MADNKGCLCGWLSVVDGTSSLQWTSTLR